MIKKIQEIKKVDLLLIIVGILQGLNYVMAKISLSEMDPLVFNTLRFFIGTVLCWVILIFKGNGYSVNKDQIMKLVLMGVIAQGINQLGFVYGISRTSVAVSALIQASTPIFVFIISSIFKVDKFNKKTMYSIIVSISGVVLVIIGSSKFGINSNNSLLGSLLVLMATLGWSTYTIMMKVFFPNESPIKITAYSHSLTTITFFLLSYKDLIRSFDHSYSNGVWFGVLFSGALVIGVSYFLWNYGVKIVGPTKASIYANLPPFVSAIAGWILLNERITFIQLAGGFLIIFGLTYSNSRRKNFL